MTPIGRAVLLALLAIAGCASAGPPPAVLELSPLLAPGWEPMPGQECSLQAVDSRWVENPTAMVDEDALRAVFAGAATTDGLPPYAVVETLFLGDGRLSDNFQVVETNLASPDREAFRPVIVSELPPELRSAEGQSGSALIRMVGGDEPSVEVGGYEVCPCRILNREVVDRLLQQGLREMVRSQTVRPGLHTVRIVLEPSERGNIGAVTVLDASGSPEVDQMVRDMAHRIEVTPLVANRLSRPNFVCGLPVTVRVPSPV